MQEVLNRTFLDNSFRDYGMVFGFILSALILRKIATKKITRLIFYVFRKMGRKINEKEFFDLVLAPLENFIFFSATYVALNSLNFPREFGFKIMKVKSDVLLDRMASGVLIYFFFHTLLRVTDYLAIVMEKKAKTTEDYSDDQLIIFFREFLKVILIIVCILVMIRYVFNQDVTKLLAGLSIVGAAIALAAKESIENLIASFIIFFDRPFTVGDLLKVQQVKTVRPHKAESLVKPRAQANLVRLVHRAPLGRRHQHEPDLWAPQEGRHRELVAVELAEKRREDLLRGAGLVVVRWGWADVVGRGDDMAARIRRGIADAASRAPVDVSRYLAAA